MSNGLIAATFKDLDEVRAAAVRSHKDNDIEAYICPIGDNGDHALIWGDYVANVWHEVLPSRRLASMRMDLLIDVIGKVECLGDLNEWLANPHGVVGSEPANPFAGYNFDYYPVSVPTLAYAIGLSRTDGTEPKLAKVCPSDPLSMDVSRPVGSHALYADKQTADRVLAELPDNVRGSFSVLPVALVFLRTDKY
jgi:hypothetical protein